MDKAVIVLIFPEPKDDMEMGMIIQKAQEVYKNRPDVKAILTVKNAAEKIISFIEENKTDNSDENGKG